jgi:hypothetical protein
MSREEEQQQQQQKQKQRQQQQQLQQQHRTLSGEMGKKSLLDLMRLRRSASEEGRI